MGTRPIRGLVLPGFTILAMSLILCSCNREPGPTKIDIAQPTQSKPPVELWRKRVVTKPLSEAKRDKLMEDRDRDKLAKAKGWTLKQRPMLLPDGEILIVTSNGSIDTGGPGKLGRRGASSIFDDYAMHRLIIVSPKGKLKLHKEFRWDTGASVVPDPAGEYLAFVAQDTYSAASRFNEGESGEMTISALDFELNAVKEFPVESPDLVTFSLAVSDKALIWQSFDLIADYNWNLAEDSYS